MLKCIIVSLQDFQKKLSSLNNRQVWAYLCLLNLNEGPGNIKWYPAVDSGGKFTTTTFESDD